MDVGRAPLRIGVTGHRVLTDIDRVVTGIDTALDRIERAFPDRPLAVITALAEGADRLVAERVLARRPGAALVAVLPMPVDDYARDFKAPASRAEFDGLLSRATCRIDLPSRPTRGESFLAGGVFVLDHCDILIAVWDGKRGQGEGGTASIVGLAKDRGMPLVHVPAGNRNPETGEPTSLGEEQGRVPSESPDTLARMNRSVAVESTSDGFMPPLPYRIRIGIAVDEHAGEVGRAGEALAVLLRDTILGLYDPESRQQLENARGTPVAYSVLVLDAHEVERQVAGAITDLLPAAVETRTPAEKPLSRAHVLVNGCDVLVLIEPPHGAAASTDALRTYALAKRRPVLRVTTGSPCSVQLLPGNGLNAHAIVRLDQFNRYAPARTRIEAAIPEAKKELFGGEQSAKPLPRGAALVEEKLLPYYAKASLLAKRNQHLYQRSGGLVWLLFPAAIAAVAVGIHVPAWSAAAFGSEFLLLAAIAVVVTYADRRRSHLTWIENRFLTERIRCAAYLVASGCEATAIPVPPYLGRDEHREQWMTRAFNEIYARIPPMPACAPEDVDSVRAFIRAAWLGGQLSYHRKNARRHGRSARVLERTGTVVFVLALAAAFAHVVTPNHGDHRNPLGTVLTFAAILLPAVGAALGGFRMHREYSRLAKRSSAMESELDELRERLDEAETPDELGRVLAEVEATMVGEAQDWRMIMRFVPVQYPG